MIRKSISILLVIATVFVLTACGSSGDEREILEPAAIPQNAQQSTYEDFSASYDPDKWTFDSSLGLFQIYDKGIYEAQNPEANCDNVNVVDGGPYAEELTEDDMQTIIADLEDQGAEVIVSELMDFEGEPVIYYESRVQLTNDLIDLYIDGGRITEEQIEEMGGRQALIERGSSSQIGIGAVADGHFIIITGTYYKSPAEILPAMLVILQTAQCE